MLSSLLLLVTGAGAATLRRRYGADPAINDVKIPHIWSNASDGALELYEHGQKQRFLPVTESPTPVTTYCFMVVMPNTDEVKLLKLHLQHKMLSGCSGWAVMSNVSSAEELMGPQGGLPESEILTSEHYVQAINGPMERVGKEAADVMMQAWNALYKSKDYLRFNLVARIDPDLVLFPHRLAAVLEPLRSINVVAFDGGKPCSVERGGLTIISQGLMKVIGQQFNGTADQAREDQMLMRLTKSSHKAFTWFAPNMLKGRVSNCGQAPWRAAYHKFSNEGAMKECLTQLHEDAEKQPEGSEQLFYKCKIDRAGNSNSNTV